MRETDKYDDIINMPHHTSSTRPRMSMHDRAAQFSPFAALTGYDEDVLEAARLTDTRSELTEDEKSVINGKLQAILECLDCSPNVCITYFVDDTRKSGGRYVTVSGTVRQIDEYQGRVIMSDKTSISIDRIRNIDGDIFKNS